MEQLEKAKATVEGTRETGLGIHAAAVECLLSIAISLDEKNKAEEKVRNECRADTAKMIKLMEGGLEIQRKHNGPTRNISDKTLGTVKVITTY